VRGVAPGPARAVEGALAAAGLAATVPGRRGLLAPAADAVHVIDGGAHRAGRPARLLVAADGAGRDRGALPHPDLRPGRGGMAPLGAGAVPRPGRYQLGPRPSRPAA